MGDSNNNTTFSYQRKNHICLCAQTRLPPLYLIDYCNPVFMMGTGHLCVLTFNFYVLCFDLRVLNFDFYVLCSGARFTKLFMTEIIHKT